jgi:hypothetical protein
MKATTVGWDAGTGEPAVKRPGAAARLSAAPRAVVGTAAGLLFRVGRTVLGEQRLPTARQNAWAAVCADRERARERAEVQRLLGGADRG